MQKRSHAAAYPGRIGRGLALVLGLGLLVEQTARIALFGLAGLHPWLVDSVGEIGEIGLVRPSAVPAIGFELRPDLDTHFKLAPFRTSPEGLRDRSYPRAKPVDAIRVAVIGSSFTLPAGVAIEDAFHSRLERRLWKSAPGGYEFINFAVGAHQPTQALAMLEHRALAYEPDLVLFGIAPLAEPLMLKGTVSPVRYYRPGPRAHPFFSSFAWRLLRGARGPAIVTLGGSPPRYEAPSVTERLGALSRRSGVEIVLVRLSLDAREAGNPAALRQQEAALRAGLAYLHTGDAFRGATPSSFWIHALDPHPDAAAHGIFADAIATFLAARRPGAAAPQDPEPPATSTAP